MDNQGCCVVEKFHYYVIRETLLYEYSAIGVEHS